MDVDLCVGLFNLEFCTSFWHNDEFKGEIHVWGGSEPFVGSKSIFITADHFNLCIIAFGRTDNNGAFFGHGIGHMLFIITTISPFGASKIVKVPTNTFSKIAFIVGSNKFADA